MKLNYLLIVSEIMYLCNSDQIEIFDFSVYDTTVIYRNHLYSISGYNRNRIQIIQNGEVITVANIQTLHWLPARQRIHFKILLTT